MTWVRLFFILLTLGLFALSKVFPDLAGAKEPGKIAMEVAENTATIQPGLECEAYNKLDLNKPEDIDKVDKVIAACAKQTTKGASGLAGNVLDLQYAALASLISWLLLELAKLIWAALREER